MQARSRVTISVITMEVALSSIWVHQEEVQLLDLVFHSPLVVLALELLQNVKTATRLYIVTTTNFVLLKKKMEF